MNASFNRVMTSEPLYHKLNIQLITIYKLLGFTVDYHDMISGPGSTSLVDALILDFFY